MHIATYYTMYVYSLFIQYYSVEHKHTSNESGL